jgi:MFS family permease
MFPQLGAPLGFLGSTGIFLLLTEVMEDAQFLAWGWRIPFLASAVLVLVGLWVRLRITETPDFQKTLDKGERVRVPMLSVLREHPRALLSGTFALVATFVLFYLMTVFTLGWATTKLGYTREQFLLMQMVAVLFFAAWIPVSAMLADRNGRRLAMIVATVVIIVFGLSFGPLLGSGSTGAVMLFLIIGMSVAGLTYGPCGTLLADMFPTAVRYTGASLSFNLAGILGASLTPYIALRLATQHGVGHVGYYLSAAAVLTLLALLSMPRKQD